MEVPMKLKLNYIERRKSEIPLCHDAIANKDFKTMERIGHQLKGNGLTFGFENLAKIGTDLEQAAKKEDFPKAEALVHQLIEAIGQMQA